MTTGRPTFGDFLNMAHGYLRRGSAERVPGGEDVSEACASLQRLIAVIARYADDAYVPCQNSSSQQTHGPSAWSQVPAEAGRILAHAGRALSRPGMHTNRGGRGRAGSLARRLDAVSTSLVAGRDLLQTHFAADADGVRLERTEWAPVLSSPPVARAQLVEMAALARGIAVNGADVALAPGWRGAPEARRRLNTACQWLWTVSSAVQAANEQEPVADIYRELLRAIPAETLPPRVLPGAEESVRGLFLGIAGTAERACRAAWMSTSEAAWSPAMSVTSLRQTAAACTVTSHNCEIVLTGLATRDDMPMSERETLRQAAAAAGRARSGWLQTARALHKITTETRGYVSWMAAESSDLALWTGRLAYADPEWTPTSGPSRDVRDPRTLGSGPVQRPEFRAHPVLCEQLTGVACCCGENSRSVA